MLAEQITWLTAALGVYIIWNKNIVTLGNKLKPRIRTEVEQNPNCFFDYSYLDCKDKLDQIYEEKANGIKISKCEWYQFGEKSSKFFLNLEKQHSLLNPVRTLLFGEKEVSGNHKINQELECFLQNTLYWKIRISKEDINVYLSQINLPILIEEQSQTCEAPITQSELLNVLKSVQNNKSSGNDCPTK